MTITLTKKENALKRTGPVVLVIMDGIKYPVPHIGNLGVSQNSYTVISESKKLGKKSICAFHIVLILRTKIFYHHIFFLFHSKCNDEGQTGDPTNTYQPISRD